MNAFATETLRSSHSWDIDYGAASHDWACWIPGRHHDELTGPATHTDTVTGAADADHPWAETLSVA